MYRRGPFRSDQPKFSGLAPTCRGRHDWPDSLVISSAGNEAAVGKQATSIVN